VSSRFRDMLRHMRPAQVKQMADVHQAFQRALLEPTGAMTLHGATVLGHLRNFCCAGDTTIRPNKTGMIDPLALAVAEGRRQVWIEIEQTLQLSPQELAEIDREYAKLMLDPAQRMMDR
jgi:hypothetical protein